MAPALVELDLRGLLCPLTWARTKYALQTLAAEQELRVLVDHRPAVPDIRRNAEELGHEVLSARELAARELPAQPEASAVLAVWELRLKRGQGSPMNTLP